VQTRLDVDVLDCEPMSSALCVRHLVRPTATVTIGEIRQQLSAATAELEQARATMRQANAEKDVRCTVCAC